LSISNQLKRYLKVKKLFLSLVLTTAALTGCASAPRHSADGALDFSKFSGIVVESVRIAPGASTRLDVKTREKLERQLTTSLRAGVQPYTRSDASAPNVLRVELLITELEASNPAVNAVSQSLLFVALDRGGISFEAKLYAGKGTEPVSFEKYQRTAGPFDMPAVYTRYKHALDAVNEWGEGLAGRLTNNGIVARL
jgi:hypothetical protein